MFLIVPFLSSFVVNVDYPSGGCVGFALLPTLQFLILYFCSSTFSTEEYIRKRIHSICVMLYLLHYFCFLFIKETYQGFSLAHPPSSSLLNKSVFLLSSTLFYTLF